MTGRVGLTPNQDIFDTTVYALTGFHGFHVPIGLLLTIMVVLVIGGKFRGAHPSAYNAAPILPRTIRSRCIDTSSTGCGS